MFDYRKKLEKHLGRKLKSTEIVHHIDGNSNNNSLDNLHIVTKSHHAKIHNKFKKDWQIDLYIRMLEEQDKDLIKAIKALKLFFTSRQIQLIYKKFKGGKLSKTEREYYSRSIKKKLKALANPVLHNKSRELIYIGL